MACGETHWPSYVPQAVRQWYESAETQALYCVNEKSARTVLGLITDDRMRKVYAKITGDFEEVTDDERGTVRIRPIILGFIEAVFDGIREYKKFRRYKSLAGLDTKPLTDALKFLNQAILAKDTVLRLEAEKARDALLAFQKNLKRTLQVSQYLYEEKSIGAMRDLETDELIDIFNPSHLLSSRKYRGEKGYAAFLMRHLALFLLQNTCERNGRFYDEIGLVTEIILGSATAQYNAESVRKAVQDVVKSYSD